MGTKKLKTNAPETILKSEIYTTNLGFLFPSHASVHHIYSVRDVMGTDDDMIRHMI